MKVKLISLACALLVFASSCNKQPLACFTADKTSVEISELVTFESCTKDANEVLWDFGDGVTAEGNTATHAWTTPGTYLVQIRATSKNNKKIDRYTIAITVKGYTRYLTKAVLTNFAPLKPNGSTWDDQSLIAQPEPDIYLRLRLENGDWEYNSSFKANMTPLNLPATWALTQENIYLSNQNWVIEVRDDDSFGTNFASELMTSWTINPATAGTDGVISFTNGTYALDLYFVHRQ